MKSNLIKVDKKIKPLPFEKRTIPELIIGGNYYICWGENQVRPCILLEIRENDKMVVMDRNPPIIMKTARKGDPLIINAVTVFYDEIGLTPIQAVQNTVSW